MTFIRIITKVVIGIHAGIAGIAIRGTIPGMIRGFMAGTARGITVAGIGIFISTGTARGIMVGTVHGTVHGTTVGMILGSMVDGDTLTIGDMAVIIPVSMMGYMSV